MTSVGASGFAWSSSPNASGSVNAGNLGFDATVVNPLNNNNRANGFPVRCVQHLHHGSCFSPFSGSAHAPFSDQMNKKNGGGNNIKQKWLSLQQTQLLNPKSMKKFLFLMAFAAMAWGTEPLSAQSLEPEFEGEVVAVFPDGSSHKLEKHNVRIKTGAGVYIAGFAAAKQKTKVVIDGSTAGVRLDGSQPIELIVRAKDNKADPMSIVRVFRMKATAKNRSAVISAVGTFNVQSNTMEYLPFTASKYGESSYRLVFETRPNGEYGVIVSNPNNVDEKMVIVSTFAIDNGSDPKKK